MTFAVSVAMPITMPVTVSVVGRCEHPTCSVPVGCISEDTILDVATEEALLGEWHGILKRVVSPAVHTAEEKRSSVLAGNVLIQVVLEELLLSRFHS